jgi:outer membrane protein, heavy metal efflux system
MDRIQMINKPVLSLIAPLALMAGCVSTPSPAYGPDQAAPAAVTRPASAPLPEPGPDSTLDNLVAYAVAMNPGLQSGREEHAAAWSMAAGARSWPDPNLTYKYNLEPVDTAMGPQQHAFVVTQVIPAPGKLQAGGAVADAEIAVRQAGVARREAGIREQVRRLYAELYLRLREAALREENVARLHELEPVVAAAYEAGTAAYADLLRIQVETARAGEDLAAARDGRDAAAAELNAVLGRPPAAVLPVPVLPDAGSTAMAALDDPALRQRIRAESPALAESRARIEQADRTVHRASIIDRPDIMVGVEWSIVGTSATPVDNNGRDMVQVMLGLNIPLFLGKYRAEEASAQAMDRAARAEAHDMENMLLAEARNHLRDIQAAGRRITLIRDDLLPKARQAFDVDRTAFAAGKTGFTELIDAQGEIIDLALMLEQERAMQANAFSALGVLINVDQPLSKETKP